jgi:ABC-type dipeptide/oligopeptide/nickel transport system ATPase component
MVMYQGKLVEQGTAQAVFEHPQEAYTQALLASIPGATASAI